MTGEEKGHAATALTGAAVLFVLLRLLAVSRYDLHVAFAVLHSLDLEDAPGLFLGTFLADSRISGPLLALLVPLTVFYTVNRRSTATALGAVVLLAFLVAHVLTYRGWWVPLAAVLLGGVLLLVERARRNPAAQGVVTFLLRRFGCWCWARRCSWRRWWGRRGCRWSGSSSWTGNCAGTSWRPATGS